MNSLIQQIQSSLLNLLGSTIEVLPGLIGGVIILLLTRYAAEAAQQVTAKIGERTIRNSSLQLLLAKVSYVTTWVLGILAASVIAFPGLRLGDIIAALGLGSVAVGFAFQDIFKNFLAGVLLLVQEPFRLNDQVIIGDYEGTVERIDIRTTQIRTYQGERILMPNATVFTSAVQVRTAYGQRRTDLGVGSSAIGLYPSSNEYVRCKLDRLWRLKKPLITPTLIFPILFARFTSMTSNGSTRVARIPPPQSEWAFSPQSVGGGGMAGKGGTEASKSLGLISRQC